MRNSGLFFHFVCTMFRVQEKSHQKLPLLHLQQRPSQPSEYFVYAFVPLQYYFLLCYLCCGLNESFVQTTKEIQEVSHIPRFGGCWFFIGAGILSHCAQVVLASLFLLVIDFQLFCLCLSFYIANIRPIQYFVNYKFSVSF